MGVESIILEDHRDVTLLWCHIIHASIADIDVALTRLFQPCNHTQAGTLAAARWADQHQELFVLDIQVDVMNNLDLTETLVDVVKFDTCHYGYSFSTWDLAPSQ